MFAFFWSKNVCSDFSYSVSHLLCYVLCLSAMGIVSCIFLTWHFLYLNFLYSTSMSMCVCVCVYTYICYIWLQVTMITWLHNCTATKIQLKTLLLTPSYFSFINILIYICIYCQLFLQLTGQTVGEVKAVADMHQRKAEMARHSDAFIALPGWYKYKYNPPFSLLLKFWDWNLKL